MHFEQLKVNHIWVSHYNKYVLPSTETKVTYITWVSLTSRWRSPAPPPLTFSDRWKYLLFCYFRHQKGHVIVMVSSLKPSSTSPWYHRVTCHARSSRTASNRTKNTSNQQNANIQKNAAAAYSAQRSHEQATQSFANGMEKKREPSTKHPKLPISNLYIRLQLRFPCNFQSKHNDSLVCIAFTQSQYSFGSEETDTAGCSP